jgi:hypothetical protein
MDVEEGALGPLVVTMVISGSPVDSVVARTIRNSRPLIGNCHIPVVVADEALAEFAVKSVPMSGNGFVIELLAVVSKLSVPTKLPLTWTIAVPAPPGIVDLTHVPAIQVAPAVVIVPVVELYCAIAGIVRQDRRNIIPKIRFNIS